MAINRWGLIRDVPNGLDHRIEDHVQFTPLSQIARKGRPNRINYMKNQRQHGSCTGENSTAAHGPSEGRPAGRGP
jgi:hypothetical protein